MTTPQPAALPELNPADIVIDVVCKALGGFAPVNTSGVRVTHKPSGVSVTVDSERSQHKNKHLAWEKLRAILAALQAQPAAAVSDEEIVAALEAAGVKFQRFMGGITGTKDCWSTAGSQDVRKLLAGVRAILALRPQAVPIGRDDLKVLMSAAGYVHATAQEKADFINGFRNAEAHHGITQRADGGEVGRG